MTDVTTTQMIERKKLCGGCTARKVDQAYLRAAKRGVAATTIAQALFVVALWLTPWAFAGYIVLVFVGYYWAMAPIRELRSRP